MVWTELNSSARTAGCSRPANQLRDADASCNWVNVVQVSSVQFSSVQFVCCEHDLKLCLFQ